MMEKISIIVPVYNVKDYVKRCLQSLVNQTYKQIEIIVVDDGSTDGSSVVIDEFAQNHPSIKVIHKENGGLMSAWTTGVRASSGDYIGFMDSDDCADINMYQHLYDCAFQSGADVVMCDFMVAEEGKILSFSISPGWCEEQEMEKFKAFVFPQENKKIISNSRCNKLFRRTLIINNLKYTKSLSRTFEDRYIVPAAIMDAKSLYYLKEPLYIYTLDREGCNSNKYKPNLIEDVIRMYETQRTMLLDKGLMDKYGDSWERSFLNYIRVYVGRNIKGVPHFSDRYQSAKKLFSNKTVQERLNKYGSEMNSKLGLAIRFSYKFNSPLLLTLFSYIAK